MGLCALLAAGLFGSVCLDPAATAHAADAPDAPTTTPLPAPPPPSRPMTRFDGTAGLEPVLVEARRDVFHLRSATAWRIVALGSPALLLVGTFAQSNVADTGLNVNLAAATTLAYSGAALMAVSSYELGRHANRSRLALTAQGLEVGRVPNTVVPVLTSISHTASLVLILSSFQDFRDTNALRQAAAGALATSLGFHIAAVGVSALQLDRNKRARDATGWLGVVPQLSRGQRGLAVVGRF
jgi:hypothetical protein